MLSPDFRDISSEFAARVEFLPRSFLMQYKVPLVFEPQPEGGYTVTPPVLPDLLTEGDTIEDALDNVRDAMAAVLELYRDLAKPLPPGLTAADPAEPNRLEMVVAMP